MFISTHGHSATSVLKIMNIPSSTWYFYLKKNDISLPSDDPHLMWGRSEGNEMDEQDKNFNQEIGHKIETVRLRPYCSKLGYRKIHSVLRRDGLLSMNHKRFFRIYKSLGFCLPKKKKFKRQGKRVCENRPAVTAPNQLWQFDIKYGYVDGENRFFYLMAFIDVFNRKVVHYHLGLSCRATDIIHALNIALKVASADPTTLVIRSDNGPQMTSYRFKKEMELKGLTHEFIPPQTPNLNAYIESFFSAVDRELFQAKRYESFSAAYGDVVGFIDHYNKERPHGSLNMMSPDDFTKKYEYTQNQNLAA